MMRRRLCSTGFVRQLPLGASQVIMRRQSELSTAAAQAPVEVEAPVESPVSTSLRHNKSGVKMKFPEMNIVDAVQQVKQLAWAKFDETIEINIVTGLDPRKQNQVVKAVVKLPHGTGRKTRIAAIVSDADVKAALDAGADLAGNDEILELISNGDVDFTTIIATPEMMPKISKLGRILGPRGLMPNPKLGTVTKDIIRAVKDAKAGQVQFKTEKNGLIQAGVGKRSFSDEALLENIRTFMLAVQSAKPEGSKGRYLRRVTLSSTMGPGIPIELRTVDPMSARFMLKL